MTNRFDRMDDVLDRIENQIDIGRMQVRELSFALDDLAYNMQRLGWLPVGFTSTDEEG